jgi:hypothetical protein
MPVRAQLSPSGFVPAAGLTVSGATDRRRASWAALLERRTCHYPNAPRRRHRRRGVAWTAAGVRPERLACLGIEGVHRPGSDRQVAAEHEPARKGDGSFRPATLRILRRPFHFAGRSFERRPSAGSGDSPIFQCPGLRAQTAAGSRRTAVRRRHVNARSVRRRSSLQAARDAAGRNLTAAFHGSNRRTPSWQRVCRNEHGNRRPA